MCDSLSRFILLWTEEHRVYIHILLNTRKMSETSFRVRFHHWRAERRRVQAVDLTTGPAWKCEDFVNSRWSWFEGLFNHAHGQLLWGKLLSDPLTFLLFPRNCRWWKKWKSISPLIITVQSWNKRMCTQAITRSRSWSKDKVHTLSYPLETYSSASLCKYSGFNSCLYKSNFFVVVIETLIVLYFLHHMN